MSPLQLKNDCDTITVSSRFPAGGKGTLINPLKEKLQSQGPVEHFEVGAMVRAHKDSQTLFGSQAKNFESKGLMVPDELIIPQIRRSLELLQPNATWLLDGYPRTGGQIGGYEGIMEENDRNDMFVYLNVPREVAEERMIRRGEQAKSAGKAPRADDVDPVARRNRLDGAERDMEPVIMRAAERGKLIEINAAQTPEQVQRAVWAALFENAPVLARS